MKLSGFVSILVLFGLLARVQGPSLADLLFPSNYCFFLVLSGRKGSLLEGRDKEQFLRCGSPFYSSFLGVAQERREILIRSLSVTTTSVLIQGQGSGETPSKSL